MGVGALIWEQRLGSPRRRTARDLPLYSYILSARGPDARPIRTANCKIAPKLNQITCSLRNDFTQDSAHYRDPFSDRQIYRQRFADLIDRCTLLIVHSVYLLLILTPCLLKNTACSQYAFAWNHRLHHSIFNFIPTMVVLHEEEYFNNISAMETTGR